MYVWSMFKGYLAGFYTYPVATPNWVTKLSADTFDLVLPLLRRTFATFPAPERRQMGERVKRNQSNQITVSSDSNFSNLDIARAEAILPAIAQLLGINNASRSC